MAQVSRENLVEDLERKNALLQELAEAAKVYATVVHIDQIEKKAVVKTSNGTLLETIWRLEVQPGESVVLVESGQIYARGIIEPVGSIVSVTKVHEEGGLVEVEGHQGPFCVMMGKEDLKVEEGCRVALDPTANVIVMNLGKPAGEYERGETGVEWEDIGGLEEAKARMIEAIEDPQKFPELYAHYNEGSPKGIALVGPPGCGKTMLGKAAATSIARLHKQDVTKGLGSGFMYVKGPEVLSKWVGEAEREIRSLYARARAHTKEKGYPAVLFIDEAEALLSKRGSGVSSDMEKTIVPSFLAEMDGVDAQSAITILATNRVDRIDSAIMRDGRVDWKIQIARPSRESFTDIVELNLRKKPIRGDNKRALAEGATEELFNSERVVSQHEKGRDMVEVLLSDLRTGAMAANLVSIAVRNAIRRDKTSGGKKRSGVSASDFTAAVEELHEMNRHIDHEDSLKEVLETRGPTKAKRAPQAAIAAA